MHFLIISIFTIGYCAIALEQKIKINKAATAILLACVCWGLVFVHYWHRDARIIQQLNVHLADISQILFFLIGAMTIVEIIDSYNGFHIIKELIRVRDTRALLWIISFTTFFASSFLDNVTTSIIMITLLRRLFPEGEERLIFASMIIVAANAGGAWTPIGDITTTMLWIKGNISAGQVMQQLFIPSVISMIVPLLFFSFKINKDIEKDIRRENKNFMKDAATVLFLGICSLVLVPVLKGVFDIPPYLGILGGLSLLWIYTDLTSKKEAQLRVPRILKKVDFSSILFFLGVLLAVAALETTGILDSAAHVMDRLFKNNDIVISLLGIASSIVDNVPLTAAVMGMYDIHAYPIDSRLWELTAYCVGTGGSMLIIGSAAGVVVMGMEKIRFGWYLRKISFPVLAGYIMGIIVFIIMNN